MPLWNIPLGTEGSSYYNRRAAASDINFISHWWRSFQSSMGSPLYCTVLADTSDTEAASFIQSYREELGAITGKDCHFFYFRDLHEAASLNVFDFSEHVRQVYPLAEFIGIDFSKFPCLLFFENIDSGKYVYISLTGLSAEEILELVRHVFDFIHHRKKLTPLERLKKFKHVQSIEVTKEALIENGVRMGRDLLESFLLSLLHLFK